MVFCLGNSKQNVESHLKDYAKVVFHTCVLLELFFFNTIVMHHRSDDLIFNTFYINLQLVFPQLDLISIQFKLHPMPFNIFSQMEFNFQEINSFFSSFPCH
jgi:hypothetical protein